MMIDHEENLANENEENVEKRESNTSQWTSLKKSLNNAEIMSQAFIFLIAGSETTATTMTFVAYLLAKNHEIQAKLYYEIEKAFNEYVSLLT
jgi:cytochrome P450